MTSNENSAVFEAALEVARRRKNTLAELRTALENHDDREALKLARRLCGLHDEQESNSTPSRIN